MLNNYPATELALELIIRFEETSCHNVMDDDLLTNLRDLVIEAQKIKYFDMVDASELAGGVSE